MKNNFIFFSLAVTGDGISGGDRIFIELARNWSSKSKITIYTSIQGKNLLKKQKISSKNIEIETIPNKIFSYIFVIDYAFKVLYSIYLGFKINTDKKFYIYSSSEFLMDVIPSAILKLRKNITWIATWYQTAPNPIVGFAESKRENTYNFKALLYWLSQLPTKPLINNFADKVIVNNESERKMFPNKKTIVLIGAVPLYIIKKFSKRSTKTDKKYDAVFQGRLHAQKGVVELIDIWKKVVDKRTNAKLAIVGDGPLRKDVEEKIREYGLDKNINLFGYLFDGKKKFSIFAQSKIVLHPAFYDSGGMAAAEAMAFGLPVVGFDLKSYESYYPKGMVKVETGNINKFSKAIVKLLNNKNYYKKYSIEAKTLIEKSYSWKKRSGEIYIQIIT